MLCPILVLVLLQITVAFIPQCKSCVSKVGACTVDADCRQAFECIAVKCGQPCTTIPVVRPTCDTSQCMITDGTCGPSPKCTLHCFDQHTQYSNAAFNNLLACLFKNKCIAQMHGDWPSPKKCDQTKPQAAAVPNFDLSLMEGRWYITRGLSDEFDTYPCQVACNRRVAQDRVNLTIWYQIPLDNGTNLQQLSNQSFFLPDRITPAHLRQHAWMNGQDDWYVIAAKADTYWFVKYCGTSDTWDGYGGAFVYTRTPTMDPALEPELRAAATKAGFNWDSMKVTHNPDCGIDATPEYGCPRNSDDVWAEHNAFVV